MMTPTPPGTTKINSHDKDSELGNIFERVSPNRWQQKRKFCHLRWWASVIWNIPMKSSIFWNLWLLKCCCIFIFCSLSLRLSNQTNFPHELLERFSGGFRRLFKIYVPFLFLKQPIQNHKMCFIYSCGLLTWSVLLGKKSVLDHSC